MLIGGGSATAQTPPDPDQPIHPTFHAKPAALPDKYTVQAETDNRLEVLENDIGVPQDGPKPRVDVEYRNPEEKAGMCGEAKGLTGAIAFSAPARCIGKTVTFGYKVKLYNPQTHSEDEVYATVTVEIVGHRVGCDGPNPVGRLVKIEGGTLDKARAPPGIQDFLGLIDGASFTVQRFCISLDPVSRDEYVRVTSRIPEETRKRDAPESALKGSEFESDPVVATAISRRMAQLYIDAAKGAGGLPMELPTIEEIVATAWELVARQPKAAETNQFVTGLRGGGLIWTSTGCEGGGGKYYLVGVERQGLGLPDKFGKLCTPQDRRSRAAFRLVVRQM